MTGADKKIANFLYELNLNQEEASIYITLTRFGILTILELSRKTHINRTRLYRLLEKLEKRGVVERVIDNKRKRVKAVGPQSLERLVKEQEAKSKRLISLFPEISTYLSGQTSISKSDTKVLFYKGTDGIKQIVWNVLKAKDESLGYTYLNLDEALGHDLAEEWRYQIVKRGIKFREIVTDLKVYDYVHNTNVVNYIKMWQTRYIPPEKLDIDHQIDIYNDVISFYSWKKDEVFGVEIYNATIVKLQKQIFNLVWELAKEKSF